MESEESVLGSGKLWPDALGAALVAWLRHPRGLDPTSGKNAADCRQSGSLEAAHSVAPLLLSGVGRLLEAVSSALRESAQQGSGYEYKRGPTKCSLRMALADSWLELSLRCMSFF
ncbi:hypothetical protein GW17_00046151 [Ensete ventricosum]|nr:hypothetical protein GW17_00046151 [Ensete ventricosum]